MLNIPEYFNLKRKLTAAKHLVFLSILTLTNCTHENHQIEPYTNDRNPELIEELDKMIKIDQMVSGIPIGAYRDDWDGWNKYRDSTHRQHKFRLEAILNEYGYPGFDLVGKDGSKNYWNMAQHCDFDPGFQKKVLSAMKIEVDNGNASAVDMAFLTDRYRINIGKDQLFGTQVTFDMTKAQAIPLSIEDRINLNKRRKSVGLAPIEVYLNMLSTLHFELTKEHYLSNGIKKPTIHLVKFNWEGIQSELQKLDEDTHIEIGILNFGTDEYAGFEVQNKQASRTTANTGALFEIGSITKVFTAYMTHRSLFNHPKWDVNTLLQDLNLSIPLHTKNKSSIAHLLNHTTGLPKMPASYLIGMIKHPRNPYLIYNRKRITNYYKKQKSKKTIGSSFNYSNFGYGVLGLVLSELEKKSYKEIFSNMITNELGLTNTSIELNKIQITNLFDPGNHTTDCLWKLNEMAPMGGAYSNIDDLMTFVRMIINKKNFADGINYSLLKMEEKSLSISEKEAVGLGWNIYTSEDHPIYYHEGGSRGYKSFIAIDPHNEKAIVMLSKNCGMNKNNNILKKIGLNTLW